MCISDSMILATLVTSSHPVNDSNLDSFGFWMFYECVWLINEFVQFEKSQRIGQVEPALRALRQAVRENRVNCEDLVPLTEEALRHATTCCDVLHIWHCIAGIAMTSMTWYHDILVAQLNITWWLWQWVLSSPVIYTHSRLHVYCNVPMVPAIDCQKTVFTAGAKAP